MSLLRFLIPAVVVAAVGVFAASEAHAKPAAKQTDKQPSREQIAQIAAALGSADPDRMRKLATELASQGFLQQADDLRAAAVVIENAAHAVPAVRPGDPVNIPLPGVAPAPAPSSGSPEKMLAAKTALMLSNSSKRSEDQGMVSAFQVQERGRGFYSGTIDGKYGPKSALALAKDFGIVPPKPFYWPLNATTAQKAYRAELLAIAEKDGPRREEWVRAADVVQVQPTKPAAVKRA